MADKPHPIGLKISLSNETYEKLKSIEKIPAVEPVTPSVSQDEVAPMEITPPEDVKIKETSDTPIAPLDTDTTTNVSTENIENSDPSDENTHAEHIHYEGDVAVYTDPSTKIEYVWCNTSNQWILKDQNKESAEDTSKKFGFENNTHTYTDTDGSVYIWDNDKSAWFPKVDDDFLAQYQMAYGFVDNTSPEKSENNDEPIKPNAAAEPPAVKKPPEEPKWFDVSQEQNNKVYVSNLPLDITEEEFVDMMQKCGLVMKDPVTQKMKIKLYTKSNSQQLKGDALCTYIRIESVDIALKILDGYVIRNHRIKVQPAKFEMKGSFNPALKPKKKRKKDLEKLKKMQDRLFDWRPEKMRGERSKHERIVIIKNLFEPSLFDEEVHLLLEYQQDMRDECSKCGEVKKVVLYDRHPEGVAQVTMKEAEDADNVVKLINGRWFGKRQLSAEIWDGRTKYRMEETDADLNKRIDGWNKFLGEEEVVDEKK